MKLGDACKVIAGQSPHSNSYNDKGLGVEFHQGKKAFGKDVIQPSGVWTTEITKMAEAGDILMSVRAPVGPTNFTDRSVCIGRGLAAIRCSELVLPQYILYALKNIESKIVGKDGAVFNSISKDMIEDLPVPKLPLSEQQRIVNLLDSEFAKIDTLKANAERNLQNAKDLFQAALKKELEPKEGWKIKTIGEIAEIKGGKRVPKGYKLQSQATGHPYIRVADFNDNGSVDLEDIHYISDAIYEGIKRYIITTNDVYISIAGTIGKSGIIPEQLDGANLTENACRLVLVDNLYNRYVWYCTTTNNFKAQIKKLTMQAAQPKLALTRLATATIYVPPFQDQQSIVTRLDTLNEKCKTLQANYEKTITLCDDLKQALLRKAFNGEI